MYQVDSKEQKKEDEMRDAVRTTYGKLAQQNAMGLPFGNPISCCGANPETDVQYSQQLGYSAEEALSVPVGANMGLGCGNPNAIASLRQGETVLDLGSGGGFDCFLAARKLNGTGLVIGVDLLPDMISKARNNAAKGNYTNVEFRLGEIEALPVADATVDIVISNCVVNLSPNKAKVFKEAARVLKPGGRIAISDVVATAEMPESIKKDFALYTGCMAGASPIDKLKGILRDAGFENIQINVKEGSRQFIKNWAEDSGAENYVASADILATKPTLQLQKTADEQRQSQACCSSGSTSFFCK